MKDKTRVTLEDIEDNIVDEYYFTTAEAITPKHPDAVKHVGLGLVTICILVLKNGFPVVGESACAHPGNYVKELGERAARTNAINKVWPLMGYELKQRLWENGEL